MQYKNIASFFFYLSYPRYPIARARGPAWHPITGETTSISVSISPNTFFIVSCALASKSSLVYSMNSDFGFFSLIS